MKHKRTKAGGMPRRRYNAGKLEGIADSKKTQTDEEFEAFRQALPALLKTDPGIFVAFSERRLIDRDSDEFALVKRVSREHPGKRVLIQRVVKTGLVDVYMDTAEFSEIQAAKQPKTRIARSGHVRKAGSGSGKEITKKT